MPRFYVDPTDLVLHAGELVLPEAPARHAVNVLRLRVGDDVTLFDGTGGEWPARIARIDKRAVAVSVERRDPVEREAPIALTLVQSLIAADMMDLIVRKATELGVAIIVPVRAQRSQSLGAEREGKRLAHWRQIAIAACEQCGRNTLPSIAPVANLQDALMDALRNGPCVILDAGARDSLVQIIARGMPAALVVGPEGGLTEVELRASEHLGATLARFGERVLRAETAALAGLATVLALAGPG